MRIKSFASFSVFVFAFAALANESIAGVTEDATPEKIIDFDAAVSFSCREVTPKSFAEKNDASKVIETSIKISANFFIQEKEFESILYKIKISPIMEVADYLPKTEVNSDIAGTISKDNKVSSHSSMIISGEAGGRVGYRVPTAAEAEAHVLGRIKIDKGSDVTSGIQINQLPSKQLILAAGTEDRAQVVYYKLRPFSQLTLEGTREFVLLLVVPKDWAGDCIDLECSAWLTGDRKNTTRKTMRIALYMEGQNQKKRELEAASRNKP